MSSLKQPHGPANAGPRANNAVLLVAAVTTGCHAGVTTTPPSPSVRSTAPTSVLPATDHDADDVIDLLDQCPDEPETYNGVGDEDGCPDMPPTGRPSWRGLVRERSVTGPSRPADCPVFRRILSSAGQIQLWYFEFATGQSRATLWTYAVNRVVRVVSSTSTKFDIISEPAYGETAALALDRAHFIRDALITAGAPADRLVVATVSPARNGSGRVGFRTRDQSLITTSYQCYDRESK